MFNSDPVIDLVIKKLYKNLLIKICKWHGQSFRVMVLESTCCRHMYVKFALNSTHWPKPFYSHLKQVMHANTKQFSFSCSSWNEGLTIPFIWHEPYLSIFNYLKPPPPPPHPKSGQTSPNGWLGIKHQVTYLLSYSPTRMTCTAKGYNYFLLYIMHTVYMYA